MTEEGDHDNHQAERAAVPALAPLFHLAEQAVQPMPPERL